MNTSKIPILYLADEKGEYHYYIGKLIKTDYGQVFGVDKEYLHNGFENVSDAFAYVAYIDTLKERNRKALEDVV